MTAGTAQVTAPPRAGADRDLWWRGAPFDPRGNSLNLIRLVLAFLVLVSHTFPIAGWGEGPTYAGENLGGWAVIGFFVVSGYLIMGSRVRSGLSAYLVHRIARIFPAFLVCLAVVAFGFAPIAWLVDHGTLRGFLTTANTPLNYIWANAGLWMSDYSVAGTPANVPYPGAWNGSLWSLFYEFVCYLVIAALALVPIVRRSVVPIAIAFVVSVLAQMRTDYVVNGLFGGNWELTLFIKLLPYFLGGSLVSMLGKRLRLSAPFAILAAVVVGVAVTLAPAWGGQLTAPLAAYAVLWVSMVLPAPALILRNDISYGAYIYAFPTQQMAVIAGVDRIGLVGYIAVCTIVTAVLATLSWKLIEEPTMKRARDAVRR